MTINDPPFLNSLSVVSCVFVLVFPGSDLGRITSWCRGRTRLHGEIHRHSPSVNLRGG
jgi:hypothetical protein